MPRYIEPVTKESIDKLIDTAKKEFSHHDNRVTVAVVTLQSDFKMTGVSYCADPNLFEEAQGEKYSLDKVREQLWELENYAYSKDVLKAMQESYQGGY